MEQVTTVTQNVDGSTTTTIVNADGSSTTSTTNIGEIVPIDDPCLVEGEEVEEEQEEEAVAPDLENTNDDAIDEDSLDDLCESQTLVPMTVSFESFSSGISTNGIPALAPPTYQPRDDSGDDAVGGNGASVNGGSTGVAGSNDNRTGNGLVDNDNTANFSLRPEPTGQFSSPVISFYSDISLGSNH